MILYHPAKDINHCIYRLINLLISIESSIELDKLRVLDFYYLFPFLIKEIKPWPSDIKELKSDALKIPNAFEKISNKKRIFFDLSEIQKNAITTLLAKNLIQFVNESTKTISINYEAVPHDFFEISQFDEFLKSHTFSIITKGLTKTLWNGKSGLKYRSGLLEYKYDE